MSQDQLTVVILLWGVIGLAVGAAIGQRKGRAGAGAVLGLLLGPLGWLVVAVGPDLGPKCRECGGALAQGARKCMHCGSDVPEELRRASVRVEAGVLRCERCAKEYPSRFHFKDDGTSTRLLCYSCAEELGTDKAAAFMRGETA